MNNKGFNWFFPVMIIALVLFFVANSMGGDSAKSIDEDSFFKEMQAGKIQKVLIDKQKQNAEVYLTKAAKTETVKTQDKSSNPFSSLGMTPKADYTLKYGDLQLFLSKFETLKAENPALKTTKDYAEGESPLMSILIQALIWITILGLFYFILFRKMGGGGGPGGQIFSIGKSKAKLFDEKERIQVTFKDVAGLEGAKEEVQEVVDFLKNSEKYTKLGGKIPKGVLLVGPPGTGKTLLAKAVAGEAKVPFFSLSGSDFVEMFVGVGASRVRDLFAQAKAKSPAIIFIDEIDAIGRARGKNNFSGGNDERENTLNQLLTEMDGFGTDVNVIVMAATNRADILDKALMRAGRFDRSIYVDLPELHERRDIFDVHLLKIKLDENVDRDFLAKQTPGFSGADIANVCNEAALIAARNSHTSVTKQDFLDAVDRIIGGLEKKNMAIKPSEKKRVAYHEAGHATISWLVEHAAPLLKVTIVPRGRSLGAAWYLPEERQLTTTEQMLDELCATLGGRAAEQVIFNNISTGALSDLESVTKRAQAMVTIYGLSPNIGNISYYDSSGQSEYSFGKPYSEETAKKIDVEIKSIIENQYQRAVQILTDNKDKLDALATKLLEKEVIFREDLEDIFGKRAWDPELTERPVTNTIPAVEEIGEPIVIKEKEDGSEIQAPESSTQI
ncbi:ATP-dependent zinc metalloprotease FtsH [Chryseobacterium indoltheticum]|uniref:ATP-dependent zinc metalloprotease FtsH n=1 Tax=Chryseobacterium indoltheticum TaxID=254 RepID=A0A381F6Z8_9FLAO|nr:ATP-dependent zinc metalloprotease FtsH [Chryseobacterium indoltheticum]AZA72744.1 ATP-dependent metallopeptidase FtsH/Yme1/Tma family protein [Chryseobacterium indoltheticum]QQQ26870.1 ATP-dependent zinc metalloprotease FtsH [Chryseobacterium indoltheticum]SIP86498.1 cell division protease FtsH [Chryseobacterium indoltheticum]SUX42340.1 ATP-dependent zinc metalloprotease FtsH [Chryseobacterium indoltheticum]